MKPTEHLFNLIKSLTQSEKRYFRINRKFYKGAFKNDFQLFDLLDSQVKFNDKRLKEKLRSIGVTGQIPYLKNQLYNQLLKSLQQYHYESSLLQSLLNKIQVSELLYTKELYTEASKMLSQTEKTCLEYEFFSELFLVYEQKIKVLRANKNFSEINNVLKRRNEILKLIDNLHAYEVLLTELLKIHTGAIVVRTKSHLLQLKVFQKNKLLTSPDNALSIKAKAHYYRIQGIYYRTIGKSQKANKFNLKLVEHIETHPFYIHADPMAYITALQNTIFTAFDIDDVDAYSECKKKLLSLPFNTSFKHIPNIEEHCIVSIYDYELFDSWRQGRIQQAKETVESLNQFLKTSKNQLSVSTQITIQSSLASMYFIIGDLNKSKKFLFRIMEYGENTSGSYIYISARIRLLILYIELKDFSYLDYLISSTRGYLKRSSQEDLIHNLLMQFARKLIKLDDIKASKDEITNLWQVLQRDLLIVIETESGSETDLQFPLMEWVESKTLGIPLNQIMSKLAGNNK